MRKALAGAAVAALMVLGGASAASAGERTGSGKGGPNGDGIPAATQGHANSICAFSGLEDGEEGGPAGPGNTQSWGQIPKPVRDVISTQGEHPGDACNGHTGFLAGGGEE
jgi:hypothetical protein